MNDLILLFLALAAGLGLGIIYFGGLWWTVQRLPKVRYPLLLVWGSFLGRMGISLLGFYGVLASKQDSWGLVHLLACLLLFFWVRNLLLWRSQLVDRKGGEASRAYHS